MLREAYLNARNMTSELLADCSIKSERCHKEFVESELHVTLMASSDHTAFTLLPGLPGL